jgi:hypothetical protein
MPRYVPSVERHHCSAHYSIHGRKASLKAPMSWHDMHLQDTLSRLVVVFVAFLQFDDSVSSHKCLLLPSGSPGLRCDGFHCTEQLGIHSGKPKLDGK